ncbi:hypothetical protein ACFX13_039947 [Malus domestica]
MYMKHRSILCDTDDFSLQPVGIEAKLNLLIFRPVRNHRRFSKAGRLAVSLRARSLAFGFACKFKVF